MKCTHYINNPLALFVYMVSINTVLYISDYHVYSVYPFHDTQKMAVHTFTQTTGSPHIWLHVENNNLFRRNKNTCNLFLFFCHSKTLEQSMIRNFYN